MALVLVAGAFAQAPVEERGRRADSRQLEAGMAYRELRQAQYEATLAEQELLNAEVAYAAARAHAEERARALEEAKRALAQARAREERARERYEEALRAAGSAPAGAAPK